ncbi:response regulator [Paraburkholderia sp. BL10I2N1]|uniref:response regulator n=1 Tax=Paraburkholderia sp. BL10I2N1 TaxID=1938796 RepID=UPI00105DCCA6|nr:response regulator [Paraburkholderia sp. BL10I2N1]TDN58952.1 two-component system phosphate regulon response regulator OmpR [Paraburkholderia sp. BL10I2N1]
MKDVEFIDNVRPYHLFVVEDEVVQRDMLCSYLEKHGLVVTPMATADEMLRRIHRVRPDLIVLDVGSPKMSGLRACRNLRAAGDRIPIILVMARCEEIERVVGLEMGADDCLSTPYPARELLARVQAVLRRSAFTPGAPRESSASIPIGEYVFDVAARSLRQGNNVRVLNTVEYAMLAELATNAGISVSRERLMAVSHSREDTVSLRAVDAAVVRLRKLLEPDPAVPRYIQTVRGHGYVFVPVETRMTR